MQIICLKSGFKKYSGDFVDIVLPFTNLRGGIGLDWYVEYQCMDWGSADTLRYAQN